MDGGKITIFGCRLKCWPFHTRHGLLKGGTGKSKYIL